MTFDDVRPPPTAAAASQHPVNRRVRVRRLNPEFTQALRIVDDGRELPDGEG
jgi:hypothetical protein